MNFTWQPDVAFLGAGGNNPRTEVINTESGETWKIKELPLMHSAYAIDIDWESGTLAIGTKGGLIYLMSSDDSPKTAAQWKNWVRVQGSPILSVCWISKALLAASDIAGRCLLWYTDEESRPQSLQNTDGLICSLLRLADSELTGLSSEGKLFFWHPPKEKLDRVIKVPSPPRLSGLVHIVYWQAEQALAFPSSEGRLILYDLEKNMVRDLEAHDGAFYAIAVWDESLLTVGMDDQLLKVWTTGSDKPTREFQVPGAVISGGVFGEPPGKLLLVNSEGTARTYTIEENKLELVGHLGGESYRVVFVPTPEKIKSFWAFKWAKEANRILNEIDEGLDRLPSDVIEKHHSRLLQLGYEHVSLAHRIDHADQSGNIVEGLKLGTSLLRILPKDHPSTCPSMEKYAALLETAWQIPEADAVCKRISSINPSHPFVLKPDGLARTSMLMKSNRWVIEPDRDIPIDRIIESATVIGKQFVGRYVFKRLGSKSCNWVKLGSEMIVEKYNQIRRAFGEGRLPAATIERVWWLSRTGNEQIDLVVLGDELSNETKGLQIALQIFGSDLGTVLSPVFLFDWRERRKGQSVKNENELASRALNSIEKSILSNSYSEAALEVLEQTLRRLFTKNKPQTEIQ